MGLEKEIIGLLEKLQKSQREMDKIALSLLQSMENNTKISTKFMQVLRDHDSQIKEIHKIVKFNQNSLDELIKHARGIPRQGA